MLDYVRLRRGRGASANSVISNLTKYRNKVLVAPSRSYGCIVDVISKKAGSQQVSDTDHRNLVEFWKQIYGIDISPDEIPLLKVKMMNSENVFTYPSSNPLLQAIARVNRLYDPGKTYGLIVDYSGITKDLQKALAIFEEEDIKGVLLFTNDRVIVNEAPHLLRFNSSITIL